MANWYRNPQDPNQAVNVDRLTRLYVAGNQHVQWFVYGDPPESDGASQSIAGPFETEGEALAVLTGIVGAVD